MTKDPTTLGKGDKKPLSDPITPVIPDYELIRVIGKGSFGEVWVALDATGSPCALKIIYKGVSDDQIFNKELEGVTSYLPISRSNLGLVTILHVGKDPQGLFYYYTMELADNASDQESKDWSEYEPLSLSKYMDLEYRLNDLREFRKIALNLSKGLDHLHRNGLVHRDIKPSNIIFVNGQARLADVGLVSLRTDATTFIGTTGYIPPEGPGKPAADVYALGKTLYELLTGKSLELFPEFPTIISSSIESNEFAKYNSIINKACNPNSLERFQDGAELVDSLSDINRNPSLEKKSRFSVSRKLKIFLVLFFLLFMISTLHEDWRELLKRTDFWTYITDTLESQGFSSVKKKKVDFDLADQEKIPTKTEEKGLADYQASPINTDSNSDSNNSHSSLAEFFYNNETDKSASEEEPRLLPRLLPTVSVLDSSSPSVSKIQNKGHEKLTTYNLVMPEGKSFFWSEMELDMPWIMPGTFIMGSELSVRGRRAEEMPKTEMKIAKGFWISSHEITQSFFSKVMGRNPSSNKVSSDHPVENVSWQDAVTFCYKLSNLAYKEKKMSRLYSFSLPTEIQWEYSCRAGSEAIFSSGNELSRKIANFKLPGPAKGSTLPAGSLLSNNWGLFDMHGNVLELTLDKYNSLKYNLDSKSNVRSTDGYVIAKGGAWNNPSENCRSASRSLLNISEKWHNVGFRICLNEL
jgi:serine/threonine protein kinase